MVSRTIPVRVFDLVVFGATGDLARRKIFPALFNRMVAGQIPTKFSIIGVARQEISLCDFRCLIGAAIKNYVEAPDSKVKSLDRFLSHVNYVSLDVELEQNWKAVRSLLNENRIRVFYLSVAPTLFDKIASKISDMGLVTDDSRIVIEKPLGSDEETAKNLNSILRKYFCEQQIYRIDHYLGKETVQNLMALRFANILFEPLWNSKFIDHVQITVAETIGVRGRGSYYNESGALKDMVQNHIMQLLCLTAMEPPSRFTPDMVRDEKLKVIQSLGFVKESDIVRGQYWENDDENYQLDVADPESTVESYIALKVSINNLRWAGTPFYLRTGKRMKNRLSEIMIVFKELTHSIFDGEQVKDENKLIIRLQPNDGITLKTNIKDPGPGGMRITSVPLDMTFADALGVRMDQIPNAYERLIMDVIRGDQTLFMRGDEVEEAWKWIDSLSQNWSKDALGLERYESYSEGPKGADELLRADGRKWRDL